MTHVGTKHPATLVKSIRCSHRDAENAHDQVDQCQIADEEVCGVVSFLVVPDKKEQEEVAGAGDQHHDRVERNEDGLQVGQEFQARKGRGRERGGGEDGVRRVAAGGGEGV